MKAVLGRTGLLANKDAFGVLPLQRASMADAVKILNKALDGGINLYDTARGYTDSEEKIGNALSSRRDEFFLATKTHAKNTEGFWKDLETSLSALKTDHIDIYQFHNPDSVPKPGDGTGLYEAMLEARSQEKIRFIGITNHRLPLAKEAVESGLYDTLQFPFNYLSSDDEIKMAESCHERNIGFIAMKALSGGLLTDVSSSRAWLNRFPGVVPIWGIQRESELDALFEAMKDNSAVSSEQQSRIDADRRELCGSFCRACGYCMPCPAGIIINICARIILAIHRMPNARFFTPEWKQEMAKIKNCLHCGNCTSHCPYGLDTPALLKKNYEEYQKLAAL
ncbi:MAG: aldo/keto reductase [Treponema sp.]|jgi:aryl-alcohol dehydrogenase-like predicted oxidoreductase|nr:aldo/keto reductase [Treponema sp.]